MNWNTIVFGAMVAWEKTKRYASACQYYLIQYFLAPCAPPTSAIRRWGHSAPLLNVPPLPNARPLAQRVVRATLNGAEDVTVAFQSFISTVELNRVSRPDVFHSTVETFLGGSDSDGAALVVEYKQGMRQFAVAYRHDIVFPPSTPAAAVTVTLPSIYWRQAEEMQKKDEALVKKWAGPCQDFYIGSTYETQFRDVGGGDGIYTLGDNEHRPEDVICHNLK